MRSLLLLLYRYRAFLVFIFAEVLCSWLIVQNNRYQAAAFFNSSNSLVGSLLNASDNVSDYFSLKNVNEALAGENARLREQLATYRDSLLISQLVQDTTIVVPGGYKFTPAKVVQNTTQNPSNYITINQGSNSGIAPGMGVIGSDGVVGKVKNVSSNFAVVTSLLHQNMKVSSKIKSSGYICTASWGGKDASQANLLYVTRHMDLQEGDTVVTSGYNAVFPENIIIGTIASFSIRDDATFYDIEVALSTDFKRLSHVYIVDYHLKQEKDSLEYNTIEVN